MTTNNDPARFGEGAQEQDASEIDASAIVVALKSVYDPEIPVNIYELGLIYDMQIDGRTVDVTMTLTTPGCPVAGEMPGMVERAVTAVEGVEQVNVELVWSPPWDMSRMSPAARLELGMD